jgi:hypothetical protein
MVHANACISQIEIITTPSQHQQLVVLESKNVFPGRTVIEQTNLHLREERHFHLYVNILYSPAANFD